MKVMEYITDGLKKGKMHMGLIDPDEQDPEKAAELAFTLEMAGSDAIMVGGSTGVGHKNVDDTVKAIKSRVRIPVILFPTDASSISPAADAIYFMSMLNSRDINKIIGEQMMGAPMVKSMGIEPLAMAYLIVEPGMTVGNVGEAELIARDDSKTAVNYALAAKYLGMDLVYLEAGSGAPEHVPIDMVKRVKEEVELPLIVGGGIRTPQQARDIARAGADIIVTGTLIERPEGIKNKIEGLISAIKN